MSVILGSTGITFPDSTTQTTSATSSGGTVTSVATGTGLTGGTITTSGTISLVTTQGAVGTYAFATLAGGLGGGFNFGSSYAGSILAPNGVAQYCGPYASINTPGSGTLSGTWRAMGTTSTYYAYATTLFIRIA